MKKIVITICVRVNEHYERQTVLMIEYPFREYVVEHFLKNCIDFRKNRTMDLVFNLFVNPFPSMQILRANHEGNVTQYN